jgi:hypothetical protein
VDEEGNRNVRFQRLFSRKLIACVWHAASLLQEMHLRRKLLAKFRFDSLIPAAYAATRACGALKLSSIPRECSCVFFQKSLNVCLFQKRGHRKRTEIIRRPAMSKRREITRTSAIKQRGLGRRANEKYLAGIYSSLVLIGDCATLYCSDRARMSCGARMNIAIWDWKQKNAASRDGRQFHATFESQRHMNSASITDQVIGKA